MCVYVCVCTCTFVCVCTCVCVCVCVCVSLCGVSGHVLSHTWYNHVIVSPEDAEPSKPTF